MSKKLFLNLIKRASTPVPKDQDKQLHPKPLKDKPKQKSKTKK